MEDLKPSSEIRFHLALLAHRSDIQCGCSYTPSLCDDNACMNWELPAVHYLVGFSGNKVPLAKYATFGSQEFSDQYS